VEERAYRSYEAQERKALKDIRRILEECPGEDASAEECPDRLRCLWEKKLDFVMARIQKERLAVEMTGAAACEPEESFPRKGRSARKAHSPTLSPHLLAAFERYIETMFDRLTRGKTPASGSRAKGRKLIPFGSPADSPH
jgi:hypothetical protein